MKTSELKSLIRWSISACQKQGIETDPTIHWFGCEWVEEENKWRADSSNKVCPFGAVLLAKQLRPENSERIFLTVTLQNVLKYGYENFGHNENIIKDILMRNLNLDSDYFREFWSGAQSGNGTSEAARLGQYFYRRSLGDKNE